MFSADTARRLEAHFKADQAKVRAELTCKKAAKKRQADAMEAKRNGRTTWNGGEGGISFGAKAKAMKRDATDPG